MKQTGFAHILLLIILLVGLAVGVYLVQKTQILTPRAFYKEATAAASVPQNVKILELRYFPLDPADPTKLDQLISGNGDGLDYVRNWVSSQDSQALTKLTEATKYHGYKVSSSSASLNYQIVNSQEFLKMVPLRVDPVMTRYVSDYKKMLTEDVNVCDFVDNQGVSSVWVWSYQKDPSPRPPDPAIVEVNEVELNNSFEVPMDVGPTDLVAGTISSPDDADYFKFYIRQTGDSIYVEASSLPKDYDLYIYDSNRNLLASSTKTGTDTDSISLKSSQAGFYFAKLVSKNGDFDQRPYKLSFYNVPPDKPMPGTGIWESNMSMGTLSQNYWNHPAWGDYSNSDESDDLPVCQRTYFVYNYSYHNYHGVPSMIHDIGHQLEHNFEFVDSDIFHSFTYPSRNLTTENPIKACGDIHYPPNAVSGYVYDSEATVKSDCENWKPDRTGQSQDVNCHNWFGSENCTDDGGLNYYVWWMQNIPGLNNAIVYGNNKAVRNWWEFVADWDGALAKGKYLIYNLPTPTPASSCTSCNADIDKSGTVDNADYNRLKDCFGKFATDTDANGNSCEAADINKDSKINLTDFNCLKLQFNKTCQQ